MKDENKKYLRQLVMASSLGFQVVFAVFIGLFFGVWLDMQFGTVPWLTLVFLVLGVVAGFLNYYRFAVKQQEEEKGPKK